MMDEAWGEILSRHLDGDLDSDEELKLAARLKAEPSLAAELESMRRIRRSVASLAESERVPPELDSLVDPLFRGKPDPVVLRPWTRWLATAAAVILGAAVIIEVNHSSSGPNLKSMAKLRRQSLPANPTEPFTLAPLPTSSLPPGEQSLGVSDRLPANPAPEVELDGPTPLEVLGPLEEGKVQTFGGEDASGVRRDRALAKSAIVAEEKDASKGEDVRPAGAAAAGEAVPGPRREDTRDPQDTGGGAVLQSWEAAPQTGWAQLFVFIDGESAWREFTPSAMCKAGRYSVRIVVTGGAVREARPVGGAASASPSQRLCAAGLIIGLEIEKVEDGEYPAEVVVEPRGSGISPDR
jgi:hypothetical protein